jgi:hypothetical protein
MSTWKPGSRGRPPAWAIEKGIVTSKTVTKSPIKTVKTMNKTASIKDSPIKKNTWRPGSRGRVPDWYKEINPNWKDDNKDTVAERKFKDLLKKKQSTWTPGKPGRPPAWAAEYVQKQKEEEKEEKDLVKRRRSLRLTRTSRRPSGSNPAIGAVLLFGPRSMTGTETLRSTLSPLE